jgi:nucleotide-binding universal stress UspA family protein
MDGSPFGLAAVEAAVQLAAELRAEILGLFVEDANLFRLAGSPLVREISLASAVGRSLDVKSLECVLRAKADAARQTLAATAEQVSVVWSFRVERGQVVQASLASAREFDLVVMGKENPAPQGPPSRFARPARSSTRPLLLVFDDSPASRRARETIRQLARAVDSQVVVVIAAKGRAWMTLAEEALQQLDEVAVIATVQPLILEKPDQLVEQARHTQASLVLLSRDQALLDEATLELLVNELDCPLALVQ